MLKKIVALSLLLVTHVHAAKRPPSIYVQPDYDVFYKALESVQLECVADGSPAPTYTWKRNGIDFNPSGNDDRVIQLSNVGTIVFTKPEERDEGVYQCFATNSYGVSASIKIKLREAKLKEFEIGSDTRYYPQLGNPLTLNCVPPESVPPAQVFWVIKRLDGGFGVVNYDNRVTMDHEYRLRITNVEFSDRQDGRAYVCMALNPFMRKSAQGPSYFIEPQGSTEEFRPAEYMWASPEDHFGLRGSDFRIKCIFSGNPTPDVHWERADGNPLPDRATITSFGMELTIADLQFEDAGDYECWATNIHSQTRVRRVISVHVESSPYWLQEPRDVEIEVGGTAEFNCLANAVPEPQYFWFVNGVPLYDVTDSRITADRFNRSRPDRIVFSNVTREDLMVLQCNATNKLGYVWGDVYLNVSAEGPTIIQPPEARKVAAEGSSINMTCRVTGKPDPIITWYKDNQTVTGDRYTIMPSGDLNIEPVVLSDAGSYTCEAQNVYNTTSAEGFLLVRRETQIVQAPLDLVVTAGTDANFTCSATTDPKEMDNLEIRWLKYDMELFNWQPRITITNNSLTVSGTIARDSGTYTCIATNGLDQAEASANLTVKDRPVPPYGIDVQRCQRGNVLVVWTPGRDNNAPIQYYVIQYNTTFTPKNWTFVAKVDATHNTANVSLSPWANYTFRVIAYNEIGASDPSYHTQMVCRTPPAVPGHNPRNVRTIGDRPDLLHIVWTPMPEIEHNGPGFQYILRFQKPELGDQFGVFIVIKDWRTYEYFMNTPGEVYQPYEITLWARNSLGDSLQDRTIVLGFTGEAVPTEAPTNLQVVGIHDTYADLQWDFTYEEINKMPSSIRGEFRGFQIQVWQYNNKASTVREWNISAEEALETRVGNTFTGRVEGLLPVTDMQASVAIMNNFYISQPTDAVNFTTTAGSCQPGWYGDQCDQRCSEHCLPDDNAEIICFQTHGNCSAGCTEGWYTQNCSERCGENCDGGCERDTGVCVGCVGGYYGMMCEFQCGKGCVNGTCSRQDGACSCLTGWSSPDCTECNTGYYGVESCEECGYCRDDDVCNNTNGHCPRGCRDNFDGDRCDKCDTGYYGVESCEECGYCRDDDVCNNTNGHCLRGCRVNFDGDRCDSCVGGYYGMMCEFQCGKGCVNGTCGRQDGACTCLTGWSSPDCTECDSGYYGVESCEECGYCRDDDVCNNTNGHCPRGCRDGFSGDLCNKCITGRWSANCSLPCGQCAGDGSCDMDTGRCIGGCLEGFQGDVCTQKRQGDVNVAGPIVGSLLQTGALIGLSVFAALVVR